MRIWMLILEFKGLISAMKFGLLDFCLIGPVLRFSGIVRWGNEIQRILDDGRLLLQQTRAQDITSPITVLLEGWYQVFYWLRWKWRQGEPRRRCPTDFALTSPRNESLWIRILIYHHDCSRHDSNNCQKWGRQRWILFLLTELRDHLSSRREAYHLSF